VHKIIIFDLENQKIYGEGTQPSPQTLPPYEEGNTPSPNLTPSASRPSARLPTSCSIIRSLICPMSSKIYQTSANITP